jgi:hypothetical protein
MGATSSFTKDPDATLDYGVDWGAWLPTGDTISSVAWDVPSGLTQAGQSATSSVATVWLSGGTVDLEYSVRCRVTTVAGRVDDRTLIFSIAQK